MSNELFRGPFATLARRVRERREAEQTEGLHCQQQHAVALSEIARDVQGLIRRAQEIPGTYRVWTRLTDAQSEANELAEQWEGRKP